MGLRVCYNFLILEVGDLKLEVNLFSIKNENALMQNLIPKIVHLESLNLD